MCACHVLTYRHVYAYACTYIFVCTRVHKHAFINLCVVCAGAHQCSHLYSHAHLDRGGASYCHQAMVVVAHPRHTLGPDLWCWFFGVCTEASLLVSDLALLYRSHRQQICLMGHPGCELLTTYLGGRSPRSLCLSSRL